MGKLILSVFKNSVKLQGVSILLVASGEKIINYLSRLTFDDFTERNINSKISVLVYTTFTDLPLRDTRFRVLRLG